MMKKIALILLLGLTVQACKKDYEEDCASVAGSYTITEVELLNSSGIKQKPNLSGRKLVFDNCQSSTNKATPKVTFLNDNGQGTYTYEKPNESTFRLLTFSKISTPTDTAFINLFSTIEFGIQELTDTSAVWECRNTDTKNYKGFEYRISTFKVKRRFP
jgi:hypothetical protein